MHRRRYFDQVKVGEELAGVARAPIDRVQLAKYCSAVNDWAVSSLDEPAARAAGLPSVVAPSGLALGLLAPLVTEWAPARPVLKLWARFFRLLWPGDSLVCRGRVFDREGRDGRYTVELDLWSENQRGEVVVRGRAMVRLFFSADDEQRARTGQSPIVVDVARQNIVEVVAQATPPASPPKTKGKVRGAKKQ